MRDSQWRNFIAVVRRALRMPFSVVTLTMSLLWALALHNTAGLAVFGAGAAVVAVYALAKLRSESFIRDSLQEAKGRRRDSDRMNRTFRIEELDVESRVRMKSIIKLQSEIAEDVTNSPVDEVAAGLSDTVAQTEAIIERGMAMAQKRRELLRYLRRADESAIRSQVENMEHRSASETDAARRSELEASLAAKQRELDDYLAIVRAAQRVLEELDGIECAFSGLRARLVRIKSTDIADWTAANDELRTELGGLNTAVDTLEQSIEEALATRGGT